MTPEQFITRWQSADGSERANYQIFIADLCELLDLPKPDPARDDTRENEVSALANVSGAKVKPLSGGLSHNAYVFERRVIFRHGDGSTSNGFIDCYRRASAIFEAKKIRLGKETRGFDDAMLRARSRAEAYARALPAEEGRPPFLVIFDVGNRIELYAEFTRSGATYTPFPDPRSHRIFLEDLRDEAVRARLRAVWLDPLSLDPARVSARATREIASQLAGIAKALEGAGHHPERVAGFLTRCLFSMFAEDVGLLPRNAFSDLLDTFLLPAPSASGAGGEGAAAQFVPLVGALWQEMDAGGFSVVLRRTLPRFNGKLFKIPDVLPLTRDQIGLLRQAARADWTLVEPAIFGTLLERSLDPAERHSLGAQYTPRPYVERLVLPTVIEPLRERWANVQAAALLLATEGKAAAALAEIDAFHHQLCQVRVLDPACGSANFLYVTLEHMKRLEGEILDFAHSIGGGQQRLEAAGLTVDPHQFLGLEINPRAAAIAELVLWIGYLQWHFRTRSAGLPPSPILRDFHNIECRDAVLDYASRELVTDPRGRPLTRWDGVTTKPHPVTGEAVPDEAARIPIWRYVDPKPADWPAADFIVGNPPFIGAAGMRAALGDGYVEALRSTWPDVPESADYVMFWWHAAARSVLAGQAERFGFITTNSLKQTFNRRVVQAALDRGLSLAFAVPDHPWVDSADGAAVRIAMTVGSATENGPGLLSTVTGEAEGGGEGLAVTLQTARGVLHADLRIGANVAAAGALRANGEISNRGFCLFGAGFIVTPDEAANLEADAPIKDYRNGRDLTDRPRGVKVIDLFGLTADDVRRRYPATYQWVLERVKPERDNNKRESRRKNWWLFGEPNPKIRQQVAGLPRYIATVETAKHRVFQFLDAAIAPDNKLICLALDDAYALGVLSSRVHVAWALAAGSTLEDRPVYVKTTCFETFPFPVATPDQHARIRDLAEQLDAHRKARQAAHPALTLTGMYNVLEKLKAGDALSAKDKTLHEQGLLSVLTTLHAELDAAVLAAYGWSDLAGNADPEAILLRLVALNAERAREEAAGQVRWLRPAFQNPQASLAAVDPEKGPESASPATRPGAPAVTEKSPWPATLPEQMALLVRLLAETPQSEARLAARIAGKGPWKKRLPDLLQTLAALGRARHEGETWVSV